MKNGAFVVFRKEMARFLGDKRLFFTTVILPGLMIFLLYSVMGSSLSGMMKDSKEKHYETYVVNMPVIAGEAIENGGFNIIGITEKEAACNRRAAAMYHLWRYTITLRTWLRLPLLIELP